MPERIAGFDPGADPDDVDVVILERSGPGDPWRIVNPQPQPVDVAGVTANMPPLTPQPQHHRWREQTSLADQVRGWIDTYAEHEFTLTAEQKEFLRQMFEASVRDGKVIHTTTALTSAVRR